MRAKFFTVTCALIFGGILVACLWPFHSPKNEVAWEGYGNGIRFGSHGTILSSGVINPVDGREQSAWTLEMWLRPASAYESRTILAFYNPQRPSGFSLHQSMTDLLAESGRWNEEHSSRARKFYISDVFRHRDLALLTLTFGSQGTKVYINGKLARAAQQFRLTRKDFTGQLVVANSPVENDSWPGELRGLALYSRELSGAQVLQHYDSWTQTGRPNATQDERAIAVYLFNEHFGNVIHNEVGSGVNLYIPKQYLELHHTLLARPWDEYYGGRNYWKNVLINIGGFIPLGFFFYAYLALILRVRRAALTTIIIGGFISLTVETLQAFLPTRDSGMTDIITNTFGTAMGAGLCRCASIACERFRHSRYPILRYFAGFFTDDQQCERKDWALSQLGE
ncbi:MAG: VanZ family protein [Terriglobia bacterium]